MWRESKVPSIIDMSEEEYHNLNNCSYSFLSKLDRMGYRAFIGKGKVGKAMNLGSFIDCYLLTPEDLEDKFVATVAHPTGNKKLLADFVLEHSEEAPAQEYLVEAISTLGLWPRWTPEKIIKILDNPYMKYLEQIVDNKDKIQYSEDDLILANTCKKSLYESHLTEHIFDPDEYDLEVKFQVKGLFEMDGIHMKFMVDILVIDHKTRHIDVYDLKTGEEPLDSFEKSFIKYRYDIQHYIYTRGVEAIKEELGCTNYTVSPLKFIYLSKKSPEFPVIFKVPKTIDIYEGYTTKYGYNITGVKELISDYKFYNGGYTVPRRVAENNGVVILDI